jgi:hypothetical protein
VVRVSHRFILSVGGIESSHYLLDAWRTIDHERCLAALQPGLQVQFPEFTNVVGVEVREQYAIDLREGQAPQEQVFGGLGPCIHHEETAAREDGEATLGDMTVW